MEDEVTPPEYDSMHYITFAGLAEIDKFFHHAAVESVPKDGDEYGAARKTIALIKRILGK